MKYLSLCSGIEAATVAWHPLGWEAVAYSEIEKFPSQVLAHHYPQTPNLGDMTKFKEWSIESNVDLLVGGTPCQSFSVAGLRKGLDDPRGNLMLTYLAIADKYRPRWLVWENVPGVLSSNAGQDFGTFLGGLGELGYGFAYRVLDAQYFGVAQRRRRVFVVGYLGDWRVAAAVLFERHSLQGHPAPSREKRQTVTSYTPSSIGGYSEGVGTLRAHGGDIGGGSENLIAARMVAFGEYAVDGTASAMKARDYKDATDLVAQPVFEMHGQDSRVRDLGETCSTVTSKWGTGGGNVPVALQPIAFSGQMSNPQTDVDMTQTLQAKNPMAVATHDVAGTMLSRNTSGGFSNSIDYASAGYMALQSMAVRRLTPKECERLQGFPDNYTDIQSKGKPTPDGPRYKALGNSMAVPVMAWIGQRIQEVEAICKQNK
jgi:DNA (cytosine-5)-methyltransferase 1